MIYNVENIKAITVINILKEVESNLPADHARVAAYVEIARLMMNCSIDSSKFILGRGWVLTYVSRSSDLVRKKASIGDDYNTRTYFILNIPFQCLCGLIKTASEPADVPSVPSVIFNINSSSSF